LGNNALGEAGMSDKINVPEEAVKWVIRARYGTADQNQTEAIRQDLNSFACWLAENPIVPTKEQMERLVRDNFTAHSLCIAWQKEMYLAPEPSVPEEIKDLLVPNDPETGLPMDQRMALLESYRRGREAGIAEGKKARRPI
jgi:hypothetical protein